jgi:hypothetical protein
MKLLAKVLPLFLVWLLLGAPAPQTQAQVAPVLPPNLAPQWTPVPGAPGVNYAPNLAQDLFRLGTQLFYYHEGRWLQSNRLYGPWAPIPQPPQAFYNIGAPYFKKTPPGWAKGKKTGWKGEGLPPGQMKKQEGGGGLPPGQMKKLH